MLFFFLNPYMLETVNRRFAVVLQLRHSDVVLLVSNTRHSDHLKFVEPV